MSQASPALISVGIPFLRELSGVSTRRHPVRLSLSEDLAASPRDPVAAVELFALHGEH